MRQKIKREKEEDWAKAVNFIPKQDEIIIYDCSDQIRFKIGDGLTNVNGLPFVDKESVNLLDGLLLMKG